MREFIERNLPKILSVLACGGVLGTTYLAVTNTAKAEEELKQERVKSLMKSLDDYSELPEIKKQRRDIYLKHHVSTIASAVATCICIVGSNHLSEMHQAALISAYELINESYGQYRSKVIEHHGIEEHRKILNELAVERANPVNIYSRGSFGCPSLSTAELSKDDKLQLFYDGFSKRYFESTLARVMDAEYNLNRNFCLGEAVPLNEWYEFLGLEQTIEGNELGWFLGVEDEYLWLDFDHDLRYLPDGTSYIYVNMELAPSTRWQEEW